MVTAYCTPPPPPPPTLDAISVRVPKATCANIKMGIKSSLNIYIEYIYN